MRHGWEQREAVALLRVAPDPVEIADDLTVDELAGEWEAELRALAYRQRFRVIFGRRGDPPLQVA